MEIMQVNELMLLEFMSFLINAQRMSQIFTVYFENV